MRDTFRARRLGTREAEFPKILSIGIVPLDPRLLFLATAATGQGARQTLDVNAHRSLVALLLSERLIFLSRLFTRLARFDDIEALVQTLMDVGCPRCRQCELGLLGLEASRSSAPKSDAYYRSLEQDLQRAASPKPADDVRGFVLQEIS